MKTGKQFKRFPALSLAQFTWLKLGVNETRFDPKEFDRLRCLNDFPCKAAQL